jgi:hypothetical protein
MDNYSLEIYKIKTLTKILFLFGALLTISGIISSFCTGSIEDSFIDQFRIFFIATPLISGIVITTITQIALPCKKVGDLIIKADSIEINSEALFKRIPLDKIIELKVFIAGYEGETSISKTISSRNAFSFEHGINNSLQILSLDEQKIETSFFLKSQKEEKVLYKVLNRICEDRNILLNIKRN